MTQYYILVKKKGAKKWSGAVPSKKGVSLSKLRLNIRKQIKKGVVFKITNKAGVRKVVSNLINLKIKKRSIKKKILKRRKTILKRRKTKRRK